MPVSARTPEAFLSARLASTDFDGTVALTFEPSPNNIDVHEACRLVVDDMFGTACLKRYIGEGGLKNRAPVEVVQSLAPDAVDEDLVKLTDDFINFKLDILLGEIGETWPRPMPGYLDFLEQVEAARRTGRSQIDTHILSSGHEPFIDKVLEVWGVTVDQVIAEEMIRKQDPTMPVKPSPKLMDISRELWRGAYGVQEEQPDETGRILYVGDDPAKDGGLARNSGVEFVLVDPNNALAAWQVATARLGLGRRVVETAAHA